MYKCKQIIELVSQKMEIELPWLTRLEMKLHFLMCKTCKRYAQQLAFIHQALGQMDKESHTKNNQLSTQAKQRIAQKLQQVQQSKK